MFQGITDINSTIKVSVHQDKFTCDKCHCSQTLMANAAADLAISGTGCHSNSLLLYRVIGIHIDTIRVDLKCFFVFFSYSEKCFIFFFQDYELDYNK